MSLWKQFLIAVALLAVTLGLWGSLTAGGRSFLTKAGLGNLVADPAAGAIAQADPTQQTKDAAGKPTPASQAAAKAESGAPAAGRAGRGARVNLVVTEAARSETTNDRFAALGVASALHSVTLLPKASGQITGLLLPAGSQVTAGTVIATLDSNAEQIARDTARLALEDAQATLARNTQLSNGNIVAASQLQGFQLAESQAELKLRSTEIDLANRSILAPIDGTLGLLQVDNGAQVTPQTVITTIEDNSSLTIAFSVPERLVDRVKLGESVDLSPVSQPEILLKGQISAIDNRVDSASGTFSVEASLPNPDGAMRAGMSFKVNLAFPGSPHIAVSPLSVLWGSEGAYVWRVKDGKSVEKVPVRIVQRNSESVQVAGDLSDGDPIVTEGIDGLKDGAEIRLAGADAPVGNTAASPDATAQGASATGAAAPAKK